MARILAKALFFAAVLAVFPESAAQIVTVDYEPEDPKLQTAEPCQTLGGEVQTADGGAQICAGIDKSGTFCIVGSKSAFPCRGLYKHVVQCNRDYNRPAVNPFFCGEKCDPEIDEFAQGGECFFVLDETAAIARNVTLAANATVIPPEMSAKIPQDQIRLLRRNLLSTLELTFQNTRMDDMRITVGQVLILPPENEFSDPAFRVVVTIKQEGDNVVVANRQAALAEVIPDGRFEAAVTMISIPPENAATADPAGCLHSGVFQKSFTDNFSAGGEFSSCAGFSAMTRITIDIQNKRLRRLYAGIEGGADFFAGINGDADGKIERKLIKDPGLIAARFSVPIPHTPVAVPMYVYINSGLAVQAKISANIAAKYAADSIRLGVEYDRETGKLSASDSISHQWGAVNTVVSTINGSAGVSAEFIQIDIVPFVGPPAKKITGEKLDSGLKIVPIAAALNLESTISVGRANAMCTAPRWTLKGQLSGDASMRLKLWDGIEKAIPPLEFYNFQRTIAQGKIKCDCPTPVQESAECSTLRAAAEENNLNCAQSLIDDETRNYLKERSLRVAAENNSCQVAALLIDNGVDVNVNPNFDAPLHFAAIQNARETAELLISHGADVNAKDFKDDTPLHWAASFVGVRPSSLYEPLPSTRETAELLISHGANVNAKNDGGRTPLHEAASSIAPDTAEALLQNGAKVNAKDDGDFTPLHLAAPSGYAPMVELLLQNGAEVNAKDIDDNTPLHWAAREIYANTFEAAKLLLQNDAEVNAKDFGDNTPLHLAAHKNALGELLISYGADVNAKNDIGVTPLHNASIEVAKLLLQNGADVNAKINEDSIARPSGTPLHWAASSGELEKAELLISHNAEVNAKDNEGWTPLDWAIDSGLIASAEMRSLLRQHGGRCNVNC